MARHTMTLCSSDDEPTGSLEEARLSARAEHVRTRKRKAKKVSDYREFGNEDFGRLDGHGVGKEAELLVVRDHMIGGRFPCAPTGIDGLKFDLMSRAFPYEFVGDEPVTVKIEVKGSSVNEGRIRIRRIQLQFFQILQIVVFFPEGPRTWRMPASEVQRNALLGLKGISVNAASGHYAMSFQRHSVPDWLAEHEVTSMGKPTAYERKAIEVAAMLAAYNAVNV